MDDNQPEIVRRAEAIVSDSVTRATTTAPSLLTLSDGTTVEIVEGAELLIVRIEGE